MERSSARSARPAVYRTQLVRKITMGPLALLERRARRHDGGHWLTAVLLHLTSPQIAANLSLALATTCTGAAHSRLVHRKPISYLLPSVIAGAPVAYGAMRAIHFIIGL